MFEQRLQFDGSAPDPLALARRLTGHEDISLLWGEQGRVAYLACDPIERSEELDPEPQLQARPELTGPPIPRWIGLLPYECRRGLERERQGDARSAPHLSAPLWRRYGAVAVIEGSTVRVAGDDARAVASLGNALRAPGALPGPALLAPLRAFEAEPLHRARIECALSHIRAGDLYQVNLARRFDFRVLGSPIDLLGRLLERGHPPHAAAFAWGPLSVISISPELFLKTDTSGAIFTSPIKGTRPRSGERERDAASARELDQDPKERAELTMVLDVERNDLARLGRPGSVQLIAPPAVQAYGTVLHRVATLRADLRPGVTRSEVLMRMLPSGSVTGAPKIRAMDLIAELEAERRGLYTGAFGYLAHDGSLELGMAIRTLTVRDEQGHYFAGGGIVADSDPGREVEETLWKAQALLSLAAGA